jgi:hypothetical protein
MASALAVLGILLMVAAGIAAAEARLSSRWPDRVGWAGLGMFIVAGLWVSMSGIGG